MVRCIISPESACFRLCVTVCRGGGWSREKGREWGGAVEGKLGFASSRYPMQTNKLWPPPRPRAGPHHDQRVGAQRQRRDEQERGGCHIGFWLWSGQSEGREKKKGIRCAKKSGFQDGKFYHPTEGNVFWARAHAAFFALPCEFISAS